MKHFNNTTGKNKGKLQLKKLADFLGKNESTIRALRRRDSRKFEMLCLGAICKVNNIDKNKIENMISKSEYIELLNKDFSHLLKELKEDKQFIVTLTDSKKYKRVAIIKQNKNGDIDINSLGVSYAYFIKVLDSKDTIIKNLREMEIKVIEVFKIKA